MNTNTKNFCRNLKAAERKQLSEFGEACGIDCNVPLLAWKQNSKAEIKNEVRFFEVWKNALIEAPMGEYVATVDGIVIAMQNAGGVERLYFFSPDEYPAALDFYNKLQVALEKNNNF